MIQIEHIQNISDDKLWQLKNEISEVMRNNTEMREDRLTLQHYFNNIEKEVESRIVKFQKNLYTAHADVIDLIKKDIQQYPNKFHIQRVAIERGPLHTIDVVKIGKREFVFQ